jgi:uncharacterized cupredoxin-like copper-binding protein
MGRVRILAIAAVVTVGFAAVGCGSSNKDTSSSSSSTSSAGGGVSVTTAAAGSTIEIVVGDTTGLDGPMTMTVSPETATAGNVTFSVKNTGTITHEVVVLPLTSGTTYDQLAVETSGADVDKVSEDGSLGESGELAAGESKTFTIDMPAGSYALVCNIAKHYAMGMRAPFTVT